MAKEKEIKISLHLVYNLDRDDVSEPSFSSYNNCETHLTIIGSHDAFNAMLSDTELNQFLNVLRPILHKLRDRIAEVFL